jgi:hypothetical protein
VPSRCQALAAHDGAPRLQRSTARGPRRCSSRGHGAARAGRRGSPLALPPLSPSFCSVAAHALQYPLPACAAGRVRPTPTSLAVVVSCSRLETLAGDSNGGCVDDEVNSQLSSLSFPRLIWKLSCNALIIISSMVQNVEYKLRRRTMFQDFDRLTSFCRPTHP